MCSSVAWHNFSSDPSHRPSHRPFSTWLVTASVQLCFRCFHDVQTQFGPFARTDLAAKRVRTICSLFYYVSLSSRGYLLYFTRLSRRWCGYYRARRGSHAKSPDFHHSTSPSSLSQSRTMTVTVVLLITIDITQEKTVRDISCRSSTEHLRRRFIRLPMRNGLTHSLASFDKLKLRQQKNRLLLWYSFVLACICIAYMAI